MVRLRDSGKVLTVNSQGTFQFQYGAVKSGIFYPILRLKKNFQFQYGAVKS